MFDSNWWFFQPSQQYQQAPFFPLSNVPRSLRQLLPGSHDANSHHLETFLVLMLSSRGLWLPLESFRFLLDNRKVNHYSPECCCKVERWCIYLWCNSKFYNHIKKVGDQAGEIRFASNICFVSYIKVLSFWCVIQHQWDFWLLFCTVFKVLCLLCSYCASELSDYVSHSHM